MQLPDPYTGEPAGRGQCVRLLHQPIAPYPVAPEAGAGWQTRRWGDGAAQDELVTDGDAAMRSEGDHAACWRVAASHPAVLASIAGT